MMRHYDIVCTSSSVPDPEELIRVLQRAGHRAELLSVRRWGLTAIAFEMRVGNRLGLVLVDVSDDFHEGTDLATSEREMVQELVELQEAGSIRRLVHVRVWEPADTLTVQCLFDTLCATMHGRLAERQTR